MNTEQPLTPQQNEQAQPEVTHNPALHYVIASILILEAISKLFYFGNYDSIMLPFRDGGGFVEMLFQLLISAGQLGIALIILFGMKIDGYYAAIRLLFVGIPYFILCLVFSRKVNALPIILFSFSYITFDIIMILICMINKKRLILISKSLGND